jgi:NADPH-dependent glutamate synthase beta subunit-like oxidoreductase/NAD-dependent dihydropyrimidine dehydrogenase PreA subunit
LSKGALIIGGSVAGLQAAHDLADSGIRVHLVEPSPFLGREGATTVPPHLLNARLLEVTKHPQITTWTNAEVNHLQGDVGRFEAELRQHPRYIDLEKCTACGDCIEVCPVHVPGTGHTAIYLGGGQPGCATIDKQGVPPCSHACPGGIHVQGYVALLAENRFEEAIDLIREAIPFPGICGRICTHPCEINCRRAEVDSPVAIRSLKRFLSDWQLASREHAHDALRQPAATTRSQRVAIVGAGPGGMTVAHRLAQRGYPVTVFEKLPVVGGMMAVGIPQYRLPLEVIAQEYEQIQKQGVEVRLNTTIGPDGDYTLDDLLEMGYEAVCLAIGAHRSRELRIPGEQLTGVVHGIHLLRAISLSQQLPDAPHDRELEAMLPRGAKTQAVVLGGGNTAMDVSRSLRRLGVEDVRILYRRTRQEMPATEEEIDDAEQEGVQIEYLVSPVRMLGDKDTGVTGLECLRMELGEPDQSGRRRPLPVPGSEFQLDVDLVVLAIGQAPDLSFLGPEHGLSITRAERLQVDAGTFMTNRSGIFAVGDAVTTGKMAVIEAIGMGNTAAAAIDAYLQDQATASVSEVNGEAPVAHREMTEAELAHKPRIPAPLIPLEQRLTTFTEVEECYSAEQAVAEAQRCLACGPCSECLACERVCEPGAVIHNQQATSHKLEVGAIIYANGALQPGAGIYQATPADPVAGSAAAARAMFDLFTARQVPSGRKTAPSGKDPARIGVFVCQCGEYIAQVVDTAALRQRATAWPDVVHAQVLPFSCSPEGATEIEAAAKKHNLNRVVLAACSCCSIDQVCYSCTYQRVRCKENLGLFPGSATGGRSDGVHFEFVNIREQCAWVHRGDPRAATAKATALVAAAVSKARITRPEVQPAQPAERQALVVGRGKAAESCRQALQRQGIAAHHLPGAPARIERSHGHYTVSHNGGSWQPAAIVLAPAPDELGSLFGSFGADGHQPRPQPVWGGLETQRPGVFYCDPALDPGLVGQAAAARIAAWLGRGQEAAGMVVAVVDAARCRACNTCVELCEFGAPRLLGDEPQRASWIDPAICAGCGTCAAHCPSGAITAGYSTDAQLEAMLDSVLG